MKGQLLHLLLVQLKVPGDSSDLSVLLTKKSLMFLLRLNEMSGGSEKILLVSISRPIARKACDLDPIPGSLLITNLDVLMPVITGIVNLSLKSGSMPAKLKEAVLKPLLKKPNLDQTEFKNYRPVSNLSFLSKVIEKAVALQLTSYLEDNHLYEPYSLPTRNSIALRPH